MVNDKELREAVHRLVEQFQPQRIILFGSQARGTANSRSDVDLLVICPVNGRRCDLLLAMNRSLRACPFAKDIFVLSPDEYERDRVIPGTIARPAWVEGRVLYDSAARYPSEVEDVTAAEAARAIDLAVRVRDASTARPCGASTAASTTSPAGCSIACDTDSFPPTPSRPTPGFRSDSTPPDPRRRGPLPPHRRPPIRHAATDREHRASLQDVRRRVSRSTHAYED